MSPRRVASRRPAAGQGRPAAVLFVTLLLSGAGPACADAPSSRAPPELDLELMAADAFTDTGGWDNVLVAAVMPGNDDLAAADADAPALELAEGFDVQIVHSRRKFRARAMDWISDRSIAIGHVADFIVGGADSGWHLTVDPRGDDEYQLQWKARFR